MSVPYHAQINGIEVRYLPAASLTPHPQNANTHSAKQIGLIARSIESFGWTNPIIVDEANLVLA